MKLVFDGDLGPVIETVVIETLKRAETDRSRLGERIAYPEIEAASLLGVPRHVLRDARRRGEVVASKIGRKVIYSREQLQALLENTRTQ